MKIRTLLAIAAIATSSTGIALAQTGNADSSANQTQMMKKDQMMDKGSMSNGSKSDGMGMKPNSSMGGEMSAPNKQKDVSPAAPNAGVKQEK